MRKVLIGSLVAQMFLASLAMADACRTAPPSPKASVACTAAKSPSWVVNPLEGALFLSPPNGCSSICSAANGRSCSPEGNVKSCFDVNEPEGCEVCICTADLVWSCG